MTAGGEIVLVESVRERKKMLALVGFTISHGDILVLRVTVDLLLTLTPPEELRL